MEIKAISKFAFFIITPLLLSISDASHAGEPFPLHRRDFVHILGSLQGTDTSFSVNDSEFLNITLSSSVPIKIGIKSVPRIIIVFIEPLSETNSTKIVLGGLLPFTIYHLYEDDHHNHVAFTADENGSYTYVQDLSTPHLVFIQPEHLTKFIRDDVTGGDCDSIGFWDFSSKTCTLSSDVNETIQIDSDNVILDGNSHVLKGANTGFGVFLPGRKGVTVSDLKIIDFTVGIFLFESDENAIRNNELEGNTFGIFIFESSQLNEIKNNTATFNLIGIFSEISAFNDIVGNVANSNRAGIFLDFFTSDTDVEDNVVSFNDAVGITIVASHNNVLRNNRIVFNDLGVSVASFSSVNALAGNTIQSNENGLLIDNSNLNKIFNNNFIDNLGFQARAVGTGNEFSLPKPTGGNYWSVFDSPAEGCDDIDGDGFCDSAFSFIGGRDGLPWNRKDGWLGPSLPDLKITDVKPVQVVFDADINGDGRTDLVEGKETVALVFVDGTNLAAMPQGSVIDLKVTMDGKELALKTLTKPQLEAVIFLKSQQKNFIGSIDTSLLPKFVPSLADLGNRTITATIRIRGAEDADPADNLRTSKVSIKDTKKLYLVYLPIVRPITLVGYGPLDITRYFESITNGGLFINATFPISGRGFINDERPDEYFGDPTPCIDTLLGKLCLGILDDSISLSAWGWLLTNGQRDVSVGIAPPNYFKYHGFNGVGVHFRNSKGVIVEEGFWTGVAHEIGHVFGLPAEPRQKNEEYTLDEFGTTVFFGNPSPGFRVDENGLVTENEAVCFMGGDSNLFRNFKDINGKERLVDKKDYELLFTKLLASAEKDPEVMLVSGIIFKNGTTQLAKWYNLPNGTAERVIPGNFSLELLDKEGNTIREVPFDLNFMMDVEPLGTIDIAASPFSVVIEYPPNTFSVLVQKNNVTIASVNPNSKLLRDAILSIPDFGFINRPKERRNALLNKIDTLENILARNNKVPAMNKLVFDIQDKTEKWVVDYEPETPPQLSKPEILALIDRISERLL